MSLNDDWLQEQSFSDYYMNALFNDILNGAPEDDFLFRSPSNIKDTNLEHRSNPSENAGISIGGDFLNLEHFLSIINDEILHEAPTDNQETKTFGFKSKRY